MIVSPQVRVRSWADFFNDSNGFGDSFSTKTGMTKMDAMLQAEPIRLAIHRPTRADFSSIVLIIIPTTPAKRVQQRIPFHFVAAKENPRPLETLTPRST